MSLFSDDGNENEEEMEKTTRTEAILNLRELKRSDGIITMSKPQAGILQKVLSAPETSTEYRQALLLLDFMSPDEADRFSGALSFAFRYGIPIAPILDKALSRCSVKAGRVEAVIRAMTHINFSNSNRYGKKDDSRNPRKSPIS